MKTLPGTRLIVLTAIGLAAGGTILVFAQTPTPTTKAPFKFHLELKEAQSVKGYCDCDKGECANVNRGYYKALCDWNSNPSHNKHDHHIHFDDEAWDGDYSREDGTKNNFNVTQHLATQNLKDLIDFLNTAGIR